MMNREANIFNMRFKFLNAVKISMLNLLSCNAVWICRLVPTFRRNILLASSRPVFA
jgi:hypothetical protein